MANEQYLERENPDNPNMSIWETDWRKGLAYKTLASCPDLAAIADLCRHFGLPIELAYGHLGGNK